MNDETFFIGDDMNDETPYFDGLRAAFYIVFSDHCASTHPTLGKILDECEKSVRRMGPSGERYIGELVRLRCLWMEGAPLD
jgi:hypothetical protein